MIPVTVTYQLGLVEREINEILQGRTSQQSRTSTNARHLAAKADKDTAGSGSDSKDGGRVRQREIAEEDVCPICQEELLAKRQPVTYCRCVIGNI